MPVGVFCVFRRTAQIAFDKSANQTLLLLFRKCIVRERLSSSKKHAERFLLAYFFALLLTESQSYFLVSGDLFPVCGHTHHVEEIGHWDFAVLFGGMIEQLGKLSLKCQKILMGEQIPKSENHRKVVTLSVNVLLPVFRNRELLMKRQVWNVMLGAAMGEKPFVVGAYISEIRQNL